MTTHHTGLRDRPGSLEDIHRYKRRTRYIEFAVVAGMLVSTAAMVPTHLLPTG